MNFADIFIKKHNEPDDAKALTEYLHLVLTYPSLDSTNDYSEVHHILPVSIFPEYKNEPLNTVRLLYADHAKAHALLFKAFNIRAYQRPLMWMLSDIETKNHDMISRAAKRGWDSLKNDSATYDEWRAKHSDYMKSLSSEEQSRRSRLFWDNITEEQYKEFCEKVSSTWTESARDKQSLVLRTYYQDEANRIKKSIEVQQRYDSMTEDDRERIREKMKVVNADPHKRELAGIKIKANWESDSYRERMMNRKPRGGVILDLVLADGSELTIDSISKLSKEFNVDVYTIRKFLSSGKPVIDKKNSESKLNGAVIKKRIS